MSGSNAWTGVRVCLCLWTYPRLSQNRPCVISSELAVLWAKDWESWSPQVSSNLHHFRFNKKHPPPFKLKLFLVVSMWSFLVSPNENLLILFYFLNTCAGMQLQVLQSLKLSCWSPVSFFFFFVFILLRKEENKGKEWKASRSHWWFCEGSDCSIINVVGNGDAQDMMNATGIF